MLFNKYDNGGGDLTPEEKVKATNAWFTVRPWLGDMHKYEVKENSKLLPYMHEIGQDKTPNIYVPYAGVNINPEDYSSYEIPGGYTVYQDKKSGKYIITDPEYYENSDAWEWMQDKKLLGRDKVAIRYGNKDIYDLIGDPTNETRRAMMEENYPELLNQDWYKKLLTEHGIEFEYGGKVPNIPTWNYPSKGTPIYRDTTEIPSNTFATGGFMSQSTAPPDMNPETLKRYQKELIAQENPKKKGFDTETQLWQPIESPEGGTPSVGYGAKLTEKEYESGTIKIGDKQVNWREGLTDEEVEMIHMQDIKLSQSKAKTYVDNTYGAGVFDSLPQLSQMLATDYAYNTGNLSDWPKFTQALISGDVEGMKKEYVRTWENQEGERVPLKSRNRWTLAKINLLENIANEPSDDHDHATEESDRASIIDKNDPNFDILVTKRGGLNEKMLQFYNELNDLYLNETGTKLRITSGARHNTKGHHKSREEGAFAMDIGKEHGDVYSWLLNTKEGLELMNKYSLGILDETDPATMEKTGATGPHFHIGRDSGLKSRVERRLKMIQNDPASLPTLTAYINKNPKYKKAAEKLTTEQKQIVEQLPIRAKKSLFDKIYQEKLNSKVALDNELKIQVKNYNVHLDKLPKSFAFAPPKNISLGGGIAFNNGGNMFANGGPTDPPPNEILRSHPDYCEDWESCPPTEELQRQYDEADYANMALRQAAVDELIDVAYKSGDPTLAADRGRTKTKPAMDIWSDKGVENIFELLGQKPEYYVYDEETGEKIFDPSLASQYGKDSNVHCTKDDYFGCIGTAFKPYAIVDPENFRQTSKQTSNYKMKEAAKKGELDKFAPGFKLAYTGTGKEGYEGISSRHFPIGTIFSRTSGTTGHAKTKADSNWIVESPGNENKVRIDREGAEGLGMFDDKKDIFNAYVYAPNTVDPLNEEILNERARDWNKFVKLDPKPVTAIETEMPQDLIMREAPSYLEYLKKRKRRK